MDLESFRKQRGLSQQQVARALGLQSKGSVSDIIRGRHKCPLKLALEIDRWSGGEVPALTLVDAGDAALLRSFAARAAARAEARPAREEPSTIGGHA